MQGTYSDIPSSVPEENRLELKLRENVENVVCEEVKEEDSEELVLIAQAMIEFTAKNGGVGLSGPQVGINKRIIVWQSKENTFMIGFNPSYYPDGKKVNTVEGCLSYPEEEYYVSRRKRIRAVFYALNQAGNFVKIARSMSGDEAIVFAHETDHINGITIAMIGRKL